MPARKEVSKEKSLNLGKTMLSKNSNIYIAGHRGMVGSAILRRLTKDGHANVITRTRQELDLLDQAAVFDFFNTHDIDCVFLAAARVGGIHANNTYRADFIYENLAIQNNVIWGAFKSGVKDLLFLGSSCIFPKAASQPMKEEYLLTGPLEPTNEPYAVAKIAGIKLCENLNRQYGTSYRAVMPTNLYGPNDNYSLENSHVLPAIIRKFHLAKLAMMGDRDAVVADEAVYGPIPEDIRLSLNAFAIESNRPAIFSENMDPVGEGQMAPPAVVLWGDGHPCREFLHVDDMADACIHVMNMTMADYENATAKHEVSFLNVGTGKDLTIANLASLVKRLVGFTGDVAFDAARPNGTLKKLLDVSKLNVAGWQARISLEDGIRETYAAYVCRFESSFLQ